MAVSHRPKCDKVLGSGYSPALRRCKRAAVFRIVRRGSDREYLRCHRHSQGFSAAHYHFMPSREGA